MKKEKKKKTPSKFKLWYQKMKSTPKGRAYLKLIYWAIFFVFLFIFLAVTSALTSDYETPINKDEEVNTPVEDPVVPQTIDHMMQELIHGTYEYTYDIHINDASYYFEGTKYEEYEEGYKDDSNGTIHYYIDDTGVYQINANEKIPIDNLYSGLDANFFQLETVFNTMNTLGLKEDLGGYSYPVYTCSDSTYIYTLNISPDKTKITDLIISSLDGNITYLFTFNNIGGVLND